MITLAGMEPAGWCERHGIEYFSHRCPECESESEDYYADIGDADIWILEEE